MLLIKTLYNESIFASIKANSNVIANSFQNYTMCSV